MSSSALLTRRRNPYALWVAAVLLVAMLMSTACTLPTSSSHGEGNIVISGVPVVQIASPLPNATYLDGVTVNIQASISNAGPDIDRVEIAVDGAIIATFPSPNPSGAAVFSVTQAWPIAGVGAHNITLTAFRRDGSSSRPAAVEISIVKPDGLAQPSPTGSSQQAQTPPGQTTPSGGQPQTAATDQPRPTDAPTSPPAPAASPTPSKPTARFNVGVNVRSGPSTIFNPPIGSFAAGSESEITAVNPAGDWYKVKYYNGEGWVFGGNLTVIGDISSLPRDPGPPTPVPTATPIPVTPTPVTSANLVADVRVDPHPLVCNQASTVYITVKNIGSGPTTAPASVTVQAFLASNNSLVGSAPAPNVGILQAGQVNGEFAVPITVAVNYGQLQRIVVTIDSANAVPETNENDNVYTTDYVLAQGSCP